MTRSAQRVGVVVALVAGLAVESAAAAQRFDRYGRPLADAGAPLLAGPPRGGAAWRVPRRVGAVLPLAFDAPTFLAGGFTEFRLVLPLLGNGFETVELLVVDVVAEGADAGLSALPPVGPRGLTAAYSGAVRDAPSSTVVLAVYQGVLYSRVAYRDHVWVLYSDHYGRAFVELHRRPAGALGPVPGPRPPGLRR